MPRYGIGRFEFTYKEIAEKMFLSARPISGYRNAVFEKLKIQTSVRLAIYATRNGIVNL
jgi:DNA-binding NarL/FixJ family response regulator